MELQPNSGLLSDMKRMLLLLAFMVPPLCGAQTASERLDRLAAEQTERILDLFPVSEIFGRGAGPRQDRVELSFSDEHRERQRAFQRWVLKELESIPQSELGPSEKLTHQLLAWRAGTSLDWLSMPIYQHTAFIHLNGGLAFGLVQVVNRQPMRNEADYRAWFRRLQRYVPFIDDVARVMRGGGDHHAAGHRRAHAEPARRARARGHDEELAVEADDELPGVDRCSNARESRGRVPEDPGGRGVPDDPATFGIRPQRVHPEGAHDRRLRRVAGRGPDVPLRGSLRDDDRPHAGRDPRARPQGSEAHPNELPCRGCEGRPQRHDQRSTARAAQRSEAIPVHHRRAGD